MRYYNKNADIKEVILNLTFYCCFIDLKFEFYTSYKKYILMASTKRALVKRNVLACILKNAIKTFSKNVFHTDIK